jgi:hypothetical protein
MCEAGDTRLFYEAGPNPFAGDGKYYSEWLAFKRQFIDKCDAAKTPGKYVYARCPAGASSGGVFAFCTCCEGCERKKK